MTTRLRAAVGIRARRAVLGALLLLAGALAAASCGGGEGEPPPTGAASGVRPAATSGGPAATSGGLAAASGGLAAASAQEIDVWAQAMCSLQSEFEARAAALADGIDPTTLDLEQRKARYRRIGPRQVGLYADVARALSQLDPPAGASFLHQAVLLQVRGLSAALERQAGLVDAASTTAEIDATNQDVEQVRRQTGAEVRFAEQALPGPIRTALAACGGTGGLGVP